MHKYLGTLSIAALILANTAVSSFAEDDFEDGGITFTKAEIVAEAEPVVDFEEPEEEAKVEEEFIQRVLNELNLSKADYHQLLNRISDTKERLELVHEERTTLKEQIENLETQETIATEKLITVLKQIVERENEIVWLYNEIEEREVAINYQKELLGDYIKIIYQEENEFFSIDKNGEIDAFKLLLSDGSVGDNLQKLEYFNLLSEAGQQIVDRLDALYGELEERKAEVVKQKVELDDLKEELIVQRDQLKIQKEAQEKLLALTDGQESVYEDLLEETIAQQEEMVEEITRLNEIKLIAENALEDGTFNYGQLSKLLEEDGGRQVHEFQVSNLGKSVSKFNWPVKPNRGISAYFRYAADGYQSHFGVQHNAIDIPVPQGSPVYAPADGVVYVAKDNGYGYSYIILSHAGGFSTTFGHISSILVKPGEYIPEGSIIGLSGGMPGTLGAGYMTTGPHLHFEMRQNGTYVDPMDHLPLEILTEGQVIDKYRPAWEKANLKMRAQEQIER